MMKKIFAVMLTLLMVFSLVGCSSKQGEVQVEVPKSFGSYEEIENAMKEDVEVTLKAVDDSLQKLLKTIDGKYGNYDTHRDDVDGWYSMEQSELEGLIARIDKYTDAYYRMIAEKEDLDTYKDWDGAMSDCYDAWDDCLSDVYDEYDDMIGDLYDELDKAIDDGEDSLSYGEYSDQWSAMYSQYRDAWSAMYSTYRDAWSANYTRYSKVWSGFYSGNKDIDGIYKEVDEEIAKNKEKQEEIDNRKNYEVEYAVVGNKAVVTGFSGDGNYASISSTYNGYDVTAIGESAFKGSGLTGIVIWADIEEIGDYAFAECTALREISVPSETTIIGAHAFENCSKLESLIVWGNPDIGDYAFAGCSSIERFSVSSGTKTIGPHAFDGCTSLSDLIIWGVEEIGEYAFANCTALDSLYLPSSAELVRTHAFDGCINLEDLSIWGRSTVIEKDAFANCPKLKDVPAGVEPSGKSTSVSTGGVSSGQSKSQDSGSKADPNSIRPEFQKAMDDYKAFFEEYCAFMKKYSENDNPVSMMSDYLNYMTKYQAAIDALDEIEEEEMSAAEEKLYMQTMLDIQDMLLKTIQ